MIGKMIFTRVESPYFEVWGGPFSSPQTMGWHITDEKGFTAGVGCDTYLIQRFYALEYFIELLKSLDCGHHIQKLIDDGTIEIDNDTHDKLSIMLKKLL